VTSALVTALIGLIGSVFVAAVTYWTTKRREREAEWRKEKLAYYKAFIESISGIVEGDDSSEGHRLYARATNNLLLFAPQGVIEAVNAFRAENAISNRKNWSKKRHDQLLNALLLAIRVDVGIQPIDNAQTFRAVLWTSGMPRDEV
jgi:hypothetical protein